MRAPISLPIPLKRSVNRVASCVTPGPYPPLSPYDITRNGTSEIERCRRSEGKERYRKPSAPMSSSSSWSSSCCFNLSSSRDSNWPVKAIRVSKEATNTRDRARNTLLEDRTTTDPVEKAFLSYTEDDLEEEARRPNGKAMNFDRYR